MARIISASRDNKIAGISSDSGAFQNIQRILAGDLSQDEVISIARGKFPQSFEQRQQSSSAKIRIDTTISNLSTSSSTSTFSGTPIQDISALQVHLASTIFTLPATQNNVAAMEALARGADFNVRYTLWNRVTTLLGAKGIKCFLSRALYFLADPILNCSGS